MFTESRKIHLLEEVLKEKDEATLIALESVLKKSRGKASVVTSIYDFVGILTPKEADTLKRAIAETCETIDADDWK